MPLVATTPLLDVLTASPLLVLFLAIALGAGLGAVRLAGVSVGPAGALFAGLAISAIVPGVAGIVPPLLGTLGLTLFAYTIGLAAGPSFFRGVRYSAPLLLGSIGVVAGVAALAQGVGRALGMDAAEIAGTFAGSVTNTPGLAAAIDVTGTAQPAVGYALAYPYGVLGLLAAIVLGDRLSARRPTAEDRDPPQPVGYVTIEILIDDAPSLGELAHHQGATLVFSRMRRDGRERTPDDDTVPVRGDLVTVIGPQPVLTSLAGRLGRVADDDLVLDRHQLDFRRIVLSNTRYVGASVAELDLRRFEAVAGFVRRGDVDLVARPDLVVELGDRIRIVAPRDRLPDVARELGDSERAVVVADPIGFPLGLFLGLALGAVPIPLPGMALQLGAAGGPLVVGLALGRLGRSGPITWQLPYATNQALRQIGVLVFLATIGLTAGPDLVSALGSGRGPALLGLGMLLTSSLALGIVVLARWQGAGAARLAGTLAGAQNQPAVLAFAVDRTGGDDRVNLAYALVFPATFVTKILAAQVLAGL